MNSGTLAVFDKSCQSLVAWMSIDVSLDDARNAIGRPVDYEDTHVVSWGRLTIDEARRLAEVEFLGDSIAIDETLALIHEFFSIVEESAVAFYYADPNRGY